MTITEKKPLLIRIPGEITPNELPVSASAVGYDFVEGNYLIYATGSDSWVTAPPNTAGIQEYWQSDINNQIFTTGSIVVSGSVILGDAASDVVYISGSVTASNGLLVNVNGSDIARFNAGGLQVTGSVNVSNGAKIAAGGIQVAGIVPGISAPYNDTPVIIDLASGQTYGPVIRSVAGQYNFAALSLDQNGTYLGGIYGIENDPGGFGYVDGVNIYSTGASRKINFNVNQVSVGKFSSTGLDVTGSINGSSTITATTGFSGSLTRLTDGTSYIIAGSGISVSSASNGAITIAATGGGGSPGGSNTQIQYNNSGSFAGVTNLTWDGATLNATGSFKGNLDGTASYATSTANAVTASYATVAVSLTTNVFNVALNGSAPGVSTNVGALYIPASTTVTTKSLAYIGGSTVSEVAVLKMVPINSITVSASWVVTGTLTSVSLSNPVTLGPGWYDLTLETGTVSQTAFGRGLYLTSGDI
jgi:hypothetical protein